MSQSDKLSVVLSEMLFVSQEFFCGFGDSKRFTISSITSVGMGSDLPWFLLMQDSKSHCRYTWQKPSESKKTTEKLIHPKEHYLKGIWVFYTTDLYTNSLSSRQPTVSVSFSLLKQIYLQSLETCLESVFHHSKHLVAFRFVKVMLLCCKTMVLKIFPGAFRCSQEAPGFSDETILTSLRY